MMEGHEIMESVAQETAIADNTENTQGAGEWVPDTPLEVYEAMPLGENEPLEIFNSNAPSRALSESMQFRTDENRGMQSIENISQLANSTDELREIISHTPLFIYNDTSGVDHREQVLKRIDMAEKLGDVSLLPQSETFRENIKKLQLTEGVRTPETFNTYLRESFPDLQLSDEELSSIEQKLSPATFATIDTPLERTIVLANALPNLETAYSCAGHDEAETANGEGATHLYFTLRTPSNEHEELFNLLSRPREGYEVEKRVWNDIDHGFYYNRYVPDEWISENNKRTAPEIFSESARRISAFLGGNEAILRSTPESFVDDVLAAQSEFITLNPEAKRIPFAPGTKVLLPIFQDLPERLANEEYREFVFAPEREAERARLVASLEEDFSAMRKISQAPTRTKE